jgi:hypothetical protein
MDGSRRTYCVAPTLAWFKSNWFHVWGHLKTLVYATPVNDIVTLRQRVEGGCRTIRNTPGIFWTCSAVHDKTCSVLRRSTRRTFGTLTIKCHEGKECPNSEKRIFRTHVDMNFFIVVVCINIPQTLATPLRYTLYIQKTVCYYKLNLWHAECHSSFNWKWFIFVSF